MLLVLRIYVLETPVDFTTIALRSDSIILVQVIHDTMINYSQIHDPDQDHKDFMTLMRNKQTDLIYLEEKKKKKIFLGKSDPSHGYSTSSSITPVNLKRYSDMLARTLILFAF